MSRKILILENQCSIIHGESNNYFMTERRTKMAYEISSECISCGTCEPECPVDAITQGADVYEIDESKCTDCGACAEVCPVSCISQK